MFKKKLKLKKRNRCQYKQKTPTLFTDFAFRLLLGYRKERSSLRRIPPTPRRARENRSGSEKERLWKIDKGKHRHQQQRMRLARK